MNKIKVGSLGRIRLNHPASGHDSFIAYIVKAMKSVYEIEFIGLKPFEDFQRVDLLLLPNWSNFYYPTRNFSMYDLISYVKEVSRIQWYACWYSNPLNGIPPPPSYPVDKMYQDFDFEPIKAKRFLYSFPEMEEDISSLAENITKWIPPIEPLMLKKKPYIINRAFETTHKLNLALLAILPNLWKKFSIGLHAYSFDWYLDRNPNLKIEIDFVDTHLHEGLKLFRGGIEFNEFQQILAKARILCSLRAGWELQSLEAWVHGTPVITRDYSGFLAPDYGIAARCEEEGDITGILEAIEGILEGRYNSQIDRTIAHTRSISNPEPQIEIIKTCLDEDLS